MEEFLKSSDNGSFKPVIFDLSKPEHRKKMSALKKSGSVKRVVGEYWSQLTELFEITHPDLVYGPDFKDTLADFLKQQEVKSPLWQQGRWVFYPWISTLVQVLPEKEFNLVRTARNKYLITGEQQQLLYQARIGVAGLSIGSSVALALVLQGMSTHLKLADFDRLELSNLNRIISGVENLGSRKVELSAREIYQINPYSKIKIFNKGLNQANIESFVKDLDVVVDEIDDFPTKTLIRQYARKYRIPVITGTDNSDGSVLELERYDLDPNLEPFKGRIEKITYKKALQMSKQDIGKFIANLVGLENIEERMQYSFSEIGRSLVSWPQLGGAAMLNGVLISYCIRQILLGEKVKDRYVLSLDEELIVDYKKRLKMSDRVKNSKKLFGL